MTINLADPPVAGSRVDRRGRWRYEGNPDAWRCAFCHALQCSCAASRDNPLVVRWFATGPQFGYRTAFEWASGFDLRRLHSIGALAPCEHVWAHMLAFSLMGFGGKGRP